MNEVIAKIIWQDGKIEQKSFPTCESAWQWERDEKRYNSKRRKKSDRRFIEKSIYAGCTVTGKDYGGFLTKQHCHNDADYDLSNLKLEARRAMRLHLINSMVGNALEVR